MFGRDRFFLALALATTVTVGCGSSGETTGTGGQMSTSSSTTTGGSGGGSGGEAPVGAQPTALHPAMAPKLCPKPTVLAVDKLYFGDGDSGQWKHFGFNLDGKVSDGNSTDVCQPSSGASTTTAYPDGDNGIDNSFGANLLPQILSVDSTWVTDVNNAIAGGVFTVLLEMDCMPPTGNVSVLTTKLFGGTALGVTPKFDGTDPPWPVEPDLLSDPTDPESSTIVFPSCSVKGSTYDSGKNVQFILTVPISTNMMSTSIKLTLYAAEMKMTFAADRKSATGGMIGGVLNTEEFVTEVTKVAALLGFCDSSLLTDLLTQVRQASDIMADGTQDPTQTCNGISMGLGFEMKQAKIGAVGPPAPMGSTCP